MRVILISGFARSGKDSTATLIKNNLMNKDKKVIILHYADFLKSFCKENLGWDGIKDNTSNLGDGRTLLQHWGTDIIRATYPDTWVDMMIALVKGLSNEYDYVLIPDTRFPNEINKMKDNFDCVDVNIVRPNFDSNLTDEQKSHPSETALIDYPFEYELINDGDLIQLQETADTFIEDII